MFSYESQVRVRYADTDQMHVVYHGKFVEYFESGRTESIRSLGISYKEIEEMGIYMPVVRIQCDFIRPGRYDDLLTIKTMLMEIPSDHRIEFIQEAYNEIGKLICKAHVLLYFMDAATNNKTMMPLALVDKLQPFFLMKETHD
jgi:acyl-CoA thioester hydrolase